MPARPLWKWLLLLLLEVAAVLLVMSVLESVLFVDFNVWLRSATALAGAVLMLLFYRFFVHKVERRRVDDPVLPPPLRPLAGGFLVGVVLMTVTVVSILMLTPSTIRFSAPATAQMVYGLCSFFLVAVCEELLFRGVLFRLVDERLNTVAALVVSGLLFGFAHAFQDNATLFSSVAISIEAGLLLAAAYKQSGTLWVPIGLHWAWNFVEGYVYGASVSGIPESTSLLSVGFSGPDVLTGGSFGPEASVVCVGCGVVATVVYLYLYYKKRTASASVSQGEQ